MLGKLALPILVLASFIFLAGTPSARAANWDDCERRVNRAEWRLEEAIEHRGYYSREANYWRHELHEAYEECNAYQGDRYDRYDRYSRRYHGDRDRDRDREHHHDRDEDEGRD
jgi:hypothetical protein